MTHRGQVGSRRWRRPGSVLMLALLTLGAVESSASAGTAAAGGRPVVVDVNGAGEVSDGSRLYGMSVTPDGRYALFGSNDPNMPGPDVSPLGNDGAFLLYRRDLRAGTTVQVTSCLAWNSQATSWSGRTMTPDGRYVVFTSVSGCTPDAPASSNDQVYVQDLQTGQTRLVSQTSDGRPGQHGNSGQPTISDDGRYVAYQSSATNLRTGDDRQDALHVYVHDMVTGANRLVDRNADGTAASGSYGRVSGGRSLSGDGSVLIYYVYNNATRRLTNRIQDLVTGTNQPLSGVAGASKLSRDGRYVSQVRYGKEGGALPELLDLATGVAQPSSPPAPGSRYSRCGTALLDPSDRFLVYVCWAGETDPNDPDSGPVALFRRDLTAGTVMRVDTLPGVKPVEPYNSPRIGELTSSGAVLFTSSYSGFAPSGSPGGAHAFLSPPAP